MSRIPCPRVWEVIVEERRDLTPVYAVLIVAGIIIFLVGVVVLNQRS